MVLLKYNTATVTVCLIQMKQTSGVRDEKKSVLIRHVLCVHIYHIEAENVTCSSCIAMSATENVYNNQTIASENFTGMLNR